MQASVASTPTLNPFREKEAGISHYRCCTDPFTNKELEAPFACPRGHDPPPRLSRGYFRSRAASWSDSDVKACG